MASNFKNIVDECAEANKNDAEFKAYEKSVLEQQLAFDMFEVVSSGHKIEKTVQEIINNTPEDKDEGKRKKFIIASFAKVLDWDRVKADKANTKCVLDKMSEVIVDWQRLLNE